MVLAPQLQQSLALLQAPTLELKALVEQELQQNPVLEEIDERDKSPSDESDLPETPDLAEPPDDVKFDLPDSTQEKESAEPVDDFQAEFDKLVQLDQDWRDHFAQASSPVQIDNLKTVDTTEFFATTRLLTLLGMFSAPQYGGNFDASGWKMLGFVDEHVFSPPFGYYDAQYTGFVPYAEKHA